VCGIILLAKLLPGINIFSGNALEDMLKSWKIQ